METAMKRDLARVILSSVAISCAIILTSSPEALREIQSFTLVVGVVVIIACAAMLLVGTGRNSIGDDAFIVTTASIASIILMSTSPIWGIPISDLLSGHAAARAIGWVILVAIFATITVGVGRWWSNGPSEHDKDE